MISQEIALLTQIRDLLQSRPDVEQTYLLSASQPYILDRKDRKYLYLYTTIALTLSIEDFGTITTPSVGWLDITLQQGIRIYATNQTNPVPVLVRATDNQIDTQTDIQTVTVTNFPPLVAVTDTTTPPTVPQQEVFAEVFNGTTWDRIRSAAAAAGTTGTGVLGAGFLGFDGTNFNIIRSAGAGDGITSGLAAVQYGFRPILGGNDRLRIAEVFNTATATASGNTALWTPAAGKKFRLMGYSFLITQNAAQSVGGLLEITFQDGTTPLPFALSVFVPGAAGTVVGAGDNTGWVVLGNGKISSTVNNVLNINLSAALTAGEVRSVAIGTEE